MLYNQTSRDILAAADIIREGGLCKRMLWNGRGAHCTNGALMVAITGRSGEYNLKAGEWVRFQAATRQVETHLGLPHDNWGHAAIPTWNNQRSRTADEVVAALCGAAGLVAAEAMRA